ncbi:MAG: hypothetical protein K0Q64_2390, partial [Nitrobacter vulgaris]|nr:hypothetical protein [Nitrobacter vulgaris]
DQDVAIPAQGVQTCIFHSLFGGVPGRLSGQLTDDCRPEWRG